MMAQSTWQRFKFLSAADALEEGTNSSEGWIQWFCSLDNHEFLCEVRFCAFVIYLFR